MQTAVQVYGQQALERIAIAPAFNKWMYETISPYMKGDILEIGSGIGNISEFFLKNHKHLSISDYDLNYVNLLKSKFPQIPANQIHQIDLADKEFQISYQHLENKFDSLFMLNVLEHIEEDEYAIKNCKYLLKPGGILLVLVPSYSFLYSKMDKLLGHYRRYTISSLNSVLVSNHLLIRKGFYFNSLGILGWWWNKMFNKAEISVGKMTLFNKLVAVGKILDRITFCKVGLSTIIVAEKPLNS